VALLHDGFKLGMHERRLRFTNYVEDPQGRSTDIDWTLGMVSPLSPSVHETSILLDPRHVSNLGGVLQWPFTNGDILHVALRAISCSPVLSKSAVLFEEHAVTVHGGQLLHCSADQAVCSALPAECQTYQQEMETASV